MLKRDITFEDFNGNTVTETHYFNLAKTELMDLELSYEDGLEATLTRIIEANDVKAVLSEFKKIILMSYGIRSEDGKRFIKNDSVREEFSQTAAYDALFMELSTDEGAAATFIKGIVPRDLVNSVTEPIKTVELPPPPPVD